jgi:catechol 2,3-dioxygenase-like lactoylglutathione lyase family enzyme
MTVLSRSPSGAVFLDAGNISLELIPKKAFKADERLGKTGVHHLSLKVDNIQEETRRLKGKGVRFLKEPYAAREKLYLAFFDGLNNVNLQLFDDKR